MTKPAAKTTNYNPSSKRYICYAIIFTFVLLAAGVWALRKAPSQPAGNRLAAYAADVIKKCNQERHRPTCYDEEIPKLLGRLSLEETFQVTRLVQEKDQNYWYCHVLGHELSAKETAKDPSRWKDVVSRCPSGMCSNGCIHGAFQERFRTDAMPDADITTLTRELGGICTARPEWNPTGLERATCYHALGHLAMYVTAAHIQKSITLCEKITREEKAENFLQLCYDGTFMQIFQPLEPEDFALVKGKQPTKETVRDFCWKFDGKKRSSCWSESWPLFFAEVTTPKGLVEFCSRPESPNEKDRCFNALFYVLTAQFNFEERTIRNFCNDLPKERKGQCFANAASRLIETDARLIEKSLGLCQTAASIGVGEKCYEEMLLYSTYNFHGGSPEFYRLCNALPGKWKERCLSQPYQN